MLVPRVEADKERDGMGEASHDHSDCSDIDQLSALSPYSRMADGRNFTGSAAASGDNLLAGFLRHENMRKEATE